MEILIYYLCYKKKVYGLRKSQGETICEIQNGGQEMAVMCWKKFNDNNLGEFVLPFKPFLCVPNFNTIE